ncbi:hypothetical protein AS034_19805 [[Bacillus] enclensis]|uniref:YtkA-like n=1 Tax=[Bacillus] enclensis TaxID=1402860 RepID=A0A0V8H741_9BACI|nr:hypothetical protein [[Bacillus] enclensis]KSU58326.1 hypothetical protein AS034_19805 [[Bacillus] enclensis]SCC33984.1 hypothetical protein GA0061094_4103 [[Bacillus] enclensis]
MKLKPVFFMFCIFAAVCLTSCREESDDTAILDSEPVEKVSMQGTEGKFEIVKVNGTSEEPPFPVGEGRHYEVYFSDDSIEVNGKKYSMTATHKETGETVDLYEAVINNNRSGAKFALEKTGIWKIEVAVDGEHYTGFDIEAE